MTVIPLLVLLIGSLTYLSIRNPSIALVGLFSMFGVEQWAQANSAFFLENSAVINVVFGLVVGVALVSDIHRHGKAGRYTAIGVLVGLLYLYALVTTLWTSPKVNTTALWLQAAPYLLVRVLAGPLLVRRTGELATAYTYQVFVGAAVALLLYFGADWEGRQIVIGGTGRQGNPLAVAEMAGITILCAVFAVANFRASTLLRLSAVAVCLLVIVRSGSRGQLFGLVLATAIAFPCRYSIRNVKVFATTALVGVISAFIVSYGFSEYWADSGRFSEEGMAGDYALRVENVLTLLGIWFRDTRAVIVGLGNSTSFDHSVIGFYPHFVPAEILAEEGLIGALIYLAILVSVVVVALRAMRHAKFEDVQMRSALATTLAIVLYTFSLSLKQGSLLGHTTFFMSVIVMGRVSALSSQESLSRRRAAET